VTHRISGGFRHGSSIAAILAGLGPRIALAPPDEGGGGAAAGAGGGDTGGSAGAGDGAGGDDNKGGAASGGAEQSALASAAGKAAEAAAAPKPGATEGKVEGEDKVKPGEEKKPEGEAAKPKDGEPPADEPVKDVDGNPLPEKYEIKMADGVEMDAKLYEVAAPIFKEHKMSPAQAQAMTDLYTKVQGDAIAQHSAMVSGWLDEAKKDPEIGGAKYEENVGRAGAAFQAFGNERLMQIFDTYGLGNNPDVLRCFARIGNAMGEGATILPGSGTGRVSDAQAFYPNMQK